MDSIFINGSSTIVIVIKYINTSNKIREKCSVFNFVLLLIIKYPHKIQTTINPENSYVSNALVLNINNGELSINIPKANMGHFDIIIPNNVKCIPFKNSLMYNLFLLIQSIPNVSNKSMSFRSSYNLQQIPAIKLAKIIHK